MKRNTERSTFRRKTTLVAVTGAARDAGSQIAPDVTAATSAGLSRVGRAKRKGRRSAWSSRPALMDICTCCLMLIRPLQDWPHASAGRQAAALHHGGPSSADYQMSSMRAWRAMWKPKRNAIGISQAGASMANGSTLELWRQWRRGALKKRTFAYVKDEAVRLKPKRLGSTRQTTPEVDLILTQFAALS